MNEGIFEWIEYKSKLLTLKGGKQNSATTITNPIPPQKKSSLLLLFVVFISPSILLLTGERIHT
jgi:hypothetical protein